MGRDWWSRSRWQTDDEWRTRSDGEWKRLEERTTVGVHRHQYPRRYEGKHERLGVGVGWFFLGLFVAGVGELALFVDLVVMLGFDVTVRHWHLFIVPRGR